ncbi:uncharacterized protein LOC128231116 [Mya arenaria]|uniref:uncharacterized protein LOC128231116 n=1 Tax=Mya arenaria TaxID=6604 RepID=UPI0022E8F14F|nr:uncharacterized protein LOC128231116 [Mya arenaria]
MGNPSAERFNRTLLRMLGTLNDDLKANWKDNLPALVQAYNATKSSSTGFSPYFLMFGWHPRLSVDAFMGTSPGNLADSNYSSYAARLQKRMHKVAREAAQRRASQNKAHYDRRVHENKLVVGDIILSISTDEESPAPEPVPKARLRTRAAPTDKEYDSDTSSDESSSSAVYIIPQRRGLRLFSSPQPPTRVNSLAPSSPFHTPHIATPPTPSPVPSIRTPDPVISRLSPSPVTPIPVPRPRRTKRPPDRNGEWAYQQTAEFFV